MRLSLRPTAIGILALLLAGCPITSGNTVITEITTFEATPSSVTRGEQVTLTWAVSDAGSRPGVASCSITRRTEGLEPEAPFQVACSSSLTEVPPAGASATYVRYQLNVLKAPYDASDPYLTAVATVNIQPSPTVAVSVSPARVELRAGASQVFTATVTGATESTVIWAATCGTLSGGGNLVTYVAPLAVGDCSVTATSAEDSLAAGTATISVIDTGAELWTMQFGTDGNDYAASVAIDSADNIVIAGSTSGTLADTNAGHYDAFLRKYDPNGNELWTRQLGTDGYDDAASVAIDSADNIVIAGTTYGTLAATNAGDGDAFLRKYDPNGNELWTRQLGTNTIDRATAIAIDQAGAIVIAGNTSGSLAGTNAGEDDAFVRKYDPNGNELWTRQLGTNTIDRATAIAIDQAGAIVIAGNTRGSLAGTNAGSIDSFLWRLDTNGNHRWTRQFGTTGDDEAQALSVDAAGYVVISGSTDRALAGVHSGDRDVYAKKLDVNGVDLWTQQFGSTFWDYGSSVTVGASRYVILVGATGGSLATANTGGVDAFVRKMTP